MELDEDADDLEVEVELDSLGSLFMHLINNDLPQEDAEGSQADDVEVIECLTSRAFVYSFTVESITRTYQTLIAHATCRRKCDSDARLNKLQ